eukprot:gene6420-6198_t
MAPTAVLCAVLSVAVAPAFGQATTCGVNGIGDCYARSQDCPLSGQPTFPGPSCCPVGAYRTLPTPSWPQAVTLELATPYDVFNSVQFKREIAAAFTGIEVGNVVLVRIADDASPDRSATSVVLCLPAELRPAFSPPFSVLRPPNQSAVRRPPGFPSSLSRVPPRLGARRTAATEPLPPGKPRTPPSPP